jgi:hypothetical protein
MSTPYLNIRLFNAYSSQELLSIFEILNKNIQMITEHLTSDLLPLSKLIRYYSSELNKMFPTPIGIESTKTFYECTKIIQEVITLLQIHDSFTQKLDHIYIIHKGVIQDLSELKNIEEIPATNYLAVIFEIVLMNQEQLLFMKKEYKEIVISLEEKLESIEINILPLLSASSNEIQQHFFHNILFEKEISNVNVCMLGILSNINTSNIKEISKEEKLNSIAKIFTMDNERQILNKVINKNIEKQQLRDSDTKDEDQIELF